MVAERHNLVKIQLTLIRSELARVEREWKDGQVWGQAERSLWPAKDVVKLSKGLLEIVKSGLRA